MTSQLPPPGWHPDPEYPGHQRWWDGTQWTDYRAPLAASPAGRAPWTGPPLAGFWERFLATLVDGLVLAVPSVVLVGTMILAFLAATSSTLGSTDDAGIVAGLGVLLLVVPVLLLVAYGGQILYAMGFEGGHLGQTPGKWLVGVRVLDASTQRPTVPSKAFLRWLVKGVGSQILMLGYLWMLWDDQNRTWHDMAADTRVVTVAEPRVPFRELLRSWRLRADR